MTGRTAALWLGMLLAGSAATAGALTDPGALASISTPSHARAPLDGVYVDQHGRAVSLRELAAGKPMLLVPVQHGCRNLCGLTLEQLRDAIARQSFRPGRDFSLIAFGIDPRETPAAAMLSAQRLGGADLPGLSALVGKAGAIRVVTTALGYRFTWDPATQQYAHLSAVAVLASDGRLVAWIKGLGESPAELHDDLARAQAHTAVEPGGAIRLLCFHFDPPRGHSLTALSVLRWTAAGGALALAVGLAAALRGDRQGRAS